MGEKESEREKVDRVGEEERYTGGEEKWTEGERREGKTNTEDVRSEGRWAARNFSNKDIIFTKCIEDKEEEEKNVFSSFILFV